MANVVIRTGSATTNRHVIQILVDGVDLTDHVYADGFGIRFDAAGPDFPLGTDVAVTLPVAADGLELVIAEAAVSTLAVEGAAE